MTIRIMRIATSRIFGWRPKVDRTVEEVLADKRSYSAAFPVVVTRLDAPRGGMYIVDGYHRVVEAILRGDRDIATVIDPNIPRLSDGRERSSRNGRSAPRTERTSGAYRSWVDERVNVLQYLDRLWGTE